MREELAMADKHEEAKSLSLNEAERQREKAQADEIKAEMNKVLLVDAAPHAADLRHHAGEG